MSESHLHVHVEQAFARFNDREDRAAFLDVYHPDVVLHGYPSGVQGREGLRHFHDELWTAFPDVELLLEDVLVDGDRVALRYLLRGTHERDYLGVTPEQRRIEVEGMMVVRVGGDRRIVEEWHSPTELSILRQLGAIAAVTPRAQPMKLPRRSASAEAAALRLEERDA
jgi:predicted ester cyclase